MEQSEKVSSSHGRSHLDPSAALGGTADGSPLEREVSYQDAITQIQSRGNGAPETNQRTIITFYSTDPENPVNWRRWKKYHVLFAGLMTVMNSTLGSSLPSNAIEFIVADFHITSQIQLVLPISIYLIGYNVGPMLCGPLSEQYGRRPIFLITFLMYTIFTMACALAPSWSAFLVFRFFCGSFASAPIAIVGGLYADVYNDPRERGDALAYFMAATTFGPCLGPLISGFISSSVSWRWTFWFGLIFAGVTVPLVVFMPETYAPVLLHKKAKMLRKQTGNPNIVAKSELDPQTWRYIFTTVLMRPIRMLVHESIVLFTSIYLSLVYAVFYLFFQAYPLIFQGPNSIYKMSPGVAGLAFIPIGIGACLCAAIFFAWDAYLERSRRLKKPWALIEEYRRLPLACLGGPSIVISLFWLGWSAYDGVHWIVPMLSGLFFGMGYLLIFMAMLNYMTDAYETFAASAGGISSTCRSLVGALLPFAARDMYGTLGIHWASSLLAFASLAMAVIPFAFIRYGERIREGSRFCQELKLLKEQALEDEILQERRANNERRDQGKKGVQCKVREHRGRQGSETSEESHSSSGQDSDMGDIPSRRVEDAADVEKGIGR